MRHARATLSRALLLCTLPAYATGKGVHARLAAVQALTECGDRQHGLSIGDLRLGAGGGSGRGVAVGGGCRGLGLRGWAPPAGFFKNPTETHGTRMRRI